MYEGTIGEVRQFAGDFAPRQWSFCNGQLLNAKEYPGLFKVIGSKFGGDAVAFRLPNLPDRSPGIKYVICLKGISP